MATFPFPRLLPFPFLPLDQIHGGSGEARRRARLGAEQRRGGSGPAASPLPPSFP